MLISFRTIYSETIILDIDKDTTIRQVYELLSQKIYSIPIKFLRVIICGNTLELSDVPLLTFDPDIPTYCILHVIPNKVMIEQYLNTHLKIHEYMSAYDIHNSKEFLQEFGNAINKLRKKKELKKKKKEHKEIKIIKITI